MPLRKLWNSICGKSASKTSPTASNETSPQTIPVSRAVEAPQAPAAVPTAARQSVAKSGRNAVTREEKKLFRRIESLSVQSVLEIGVGDGGRSLAMLERLTHKGHSTPLHYIAIDEFESAGGTLTLRDFHKQLREYPAKAHLVPMPIDAGLDRAVRTYGQVDLIIWSADEPPTAAQQLVLSRMSKPSTVLMSQDNGKWSETLTSVLTRSQAA